MSALSRHVVISLLFTVAAQSATPDQIEFFETRIRPVLARSCYACHSSAVKSPMGGLRLDTPDGLQSVAAGKLLDAVSYTGRAKMPPAGKLPDEQLADLAAWIKMGAPSPKANSTGGARNHWAFRPVQHPPVPSVKNGAWIQSPIDAFILAKLESRGLSPAPPADKRVLIRRVSFDLTGLPPTPQEVAAFLEDKSPHAFETVVNRLLASPHYGERWARHWLDLVRFAETNGHEYDNDKLDPWRYRDYVIRAFNRDLPYNDFVREHIAGDLIPNKRVTPSGELDSPLATSFFWFGEVLNSATDPVKSRADEVDNQLDVASKAFLGLTVACARCHDHKFDPIPTADYYSLAGILHSTAKREDVIDSPERSEDILKISRQIRSAIGPVPERRVKVRYRPEDEVFDAFDGTAWEKWTPAGAAFGDAPQQGLATSLAAGSDRFVGTLTSRKFQTGQKLYLHVRLSGSKGGPERLNERGPLRFTLVNGEFKSQHIVPDGNEYPTWHTMKLTLERNRECYFEMVDRSTSGHISVDEIVFSDLPKPPVVEEEDPIVLPRGVPHDLEAQIPPSSFAMLASDYAPHDIRIHIRGSHENLGAATPRRFLRVIAGDDQPAITTGSGRLQVAEWFASPQNPLTARVMVNRIWRFHFGQGIVATPDNFGAMGDAPSHPELLDDLASRFVESGWSIKALHRLIVLSSAYQMSSRPDQAALKVDPANRLLHHMPVRRLEAEEVRDGILAVAGSLNPALFGPSVPPYISRYQDGRGKPESGPLDGAGRRSIYIQVRRNFLTPMFLAFDYPLPISAIGARSSSTVPSQALMMMNNEFVADQAKRWARRVMSGGTTPEARIRAMYEMAFSRVPSESETKAITTFLGGRDNEAAWSDVAHVLLNSAEFIYVP